jgi:hypothetical protein
VKRIVKPSTQIDFTPKEKVPDPVISDISVTRLIDDGLLALYREIKNLLMLSSKGKLDPNNSRDLRDHLKLLFELQAREKESLKNITDEQLKEQVQGVLDDGK